MIIGHAWTHVRCQYCKLSLPISLCADDTMQNAFAAAQLAARSSAPVKRVVEPAERPKTKFQVGLKKRPLPPGNTAQPKPAELEDGGADSDSDSSDEGGGSGTALGSLLGGYGDSSSSDSSSDDDSDDSTRGGSQQRATKKAKTATSAGFFSVQHYCTLLYGTAKFAHMAQIH